MIRPLMKFSPLVFAAALAASGCASLEPPRVQVQRLGRPQVGITGATLDVTFSVRNPNPDPITIERAQYDLYLNGRRVGDGFITEPVSVAGFGEAKLTSSFDVNYLGLPGAIKSVMDLDKVDARTNGRFFMRVGSSGRLRRVGFDTRADLDLSRGPS